MATNDQNGFATGFMSNRAEQILLSNFGGSYSEAYIGLLTRLPKNAVVDKDTGDILEDAVTMQEVEPTTNGKANGYERIKLGDMVAMGGYIQNSEEKHFPEATEDWGYVVGFIISSKFSAHKKPNTATSGTANNAEYYTSSGNCFIGALPEATKLTTGKDGLPHYGKFVGKETIALFRKGYLRIGLDHEPPAIEV